MSLKKTMFREYDIRGRVSSDELNPDSVYQISLAYGEFLKKRHISSCILGFDYRDISERFHTKAKEALFKSGLTVYDIGLCLTPMMYQAQYHYRTKGGMMITASHNPSGWSGFKLSYDYSVTLAPKQIKEIYRLAKTVKDKGKKGKIIKKDFLPIYSRDLLSRARKKRKLKVVLNTGNGTAGPIAEKIFSQFGLKVIGVHTRRDWSFPHYFPNPSLVKMMQETGEMVKKTKADIGIAIDGDGDRLGITDEKGNTVWPDQYMILLSRQILKKTKGAKIIFDVKSSQALADDIKAHGGIPVMWKTGHSYIKEKMRQENAPLAGEMSGHIFYNQPIYYGFDDAIFAAFKLIEYLSFLNKSLSHSLTDLPLYFTSPALQVYCPDEVKYQVVKNLTKQFKKERYQVITTSGCRVEFNDGWGLIRASSNLPALGLRFEAKTKKKLWQIKKLFRRKLSSFPNVGKRWHSG